MLCNAIRRIWVEYYDEDIPDYVHEEMKLLCEDVERLEEQIKRYESLILNEEETEAFLKKIKDEESIPIGLLPTPKLEEVLRKLKGELTEG